MKTTIALLAAALLTACSATNPPPTAEQVAAYSAAIHGIIGDYKAIKRIQQEP